MSHYTFTLLPEVYRWMVADQLIPNQGQLNEKGQVALPYQLNTIFENGWAVAGAIRVMLSKAGQQSSPHLTGILNEDSKSIRVANWNYIWLCFQELRLQFDQRIRDLILQGEYALIPQILKQLFERDQKRDEKTMKAILINQKPLQGQDKGKNNQKSTTLDVKRINLQKDPADSQSSLQFLILLLGSSFSMPVEETLGLFTNQNKYLAHLLVKGINDGYEGVILFYSLLLKHKQTFRNYIEADSRDADSLLYAVKPGLISKSVKVAELCLQLLQGLPRFYEWFISENGRGSATVCLGIKRHPYLAHKYVDLLLEIIRQQEMPFFTEHFQASFRDPVEMIQICALMLPSLANTFLKVPLLENGVFDEWASLSLSLIHQELSCKIIHFKFTGALLAHLPELAEQTQDYLSGIRRGWREYSKIQYVHLMEQLLMVLEQLAEDKRPMARRVYQILIQIMEIVFSDSDKREYLVRGFGTLISRFPKIPTQHLIATYKEGTLSSADLKLVLTSLQNAPDHSSAIKIAEILLKLFNSQPILNFFLAPIILKVCKKTVSEDPGRLFTMRVIRQSLAQYVHLEATKKMPQIAKKQPMYFVQKGNEKYKAEEEDEFTVVEQSTKNILTLADKSSDLIVALKSETLTLAAKQEFQETNAIIKKNQYKCNLKALSHIISKKFSVGREEEQQFNQEFKVKRSLVALQESMAKRKLANSANATMMSNSRFTGPEHIRKQFGDLVDKRKKEEEEKRMGDQRRQRDQALKKVMVRKELEKTNLLRGFGQEAQLKEEGFWSKLVPKQKQLELYPQELMEGRDLEYIENLFKKYHRVMRNLFFRYTSSKYTTKSNLNFEDNKERNETLNTVEIIQFLKDYKLFFLTSKDEIQTLVRDISVKLLHKRENHELDFFGFEQFVIQFCALIYTKTHTINATTNRGVEAIKKNFGHLSHLQLVEEWFNYLKLVFIQKGEKTTLFDQPEAAYFNETEVVKEFARKLDQDPTFILPEGYKKVIQKNLKLSPKISDKYTKISQAYRDVYQVLDEILNESDLRIHLLEPLIEKETKMRVKPHHFFHVKPKLMQETKARAFSSILDKKPAIPPVKMLQKKNLSLGMRLGISYLSYKDKLLGEQVAYVVDDMLTAVEAGRSNIDKQKVINDCIKKKHEQTQKEKFLDIEREKKRLERKNQLEKMKKDYTQKKEQELQSGKEERERKEQKKKSREKKIQEDREKYLSEQKAKLDEKKKQEEQDKGKKKEESKKKREDRKKKQTEFKTFNQKQLGKFKKEFDEEADKKKKEQEKDESQRIKKEQLVRKLRTRIHESDKKAIQQKQKMLEEINQLYTSQPIKNVYSDLESSVRATFDFLLRSSFLPVTLKKNNSQIIFETWHYFGLIFQLNPLIINAKEMTKIFRHFTKDKQNHKDYSIGLTYEEFKQGLLRIAIKHKSIFNKISQKIKEDMNAGEINAVIEKDIEEKEKNEFEEPKPIDVRNLVKEEDIDKKITDHYGDISKVSDRTLKGLIYYLKVPKDKQGQQKRFRDILASKVSYSISTFENLRQKLNDEYSLAPTGKAKKKKEGNQSQLLNSSLEAKEESPEAV